MLVRPGRTISKRMLQKSGIPPGYTFYVDLWNQGQQGFLLSLDGNDFGSYTVANFRSADSSGAAEGWVRSSSTANNQTIIASSDTATTTSRWMIYVAQTTGRLTISTQDAAGTVNTVSGTTDICDGKWVHWKVNSSGTTWDIDVKGVVETLIVVAGTNTGDWFADVTLRDNLTIGAMTHTSTVNYAIGEIGFTRIYSRTMATAEALTNYQRGRKATASDTTGLVFNLPLTEGTGNPADTIIPATITLTGATWIEGLTDRSTNAYAITSVGSPTWGNQGRTCDGNDDNIDISACLVSLAATTQGTWFGWFNMADVTPAAPSILIGFSDASALEILYLYVATSGKVTALCYDAGILKWALETDSTTLLTNDTPFSVTLTHNGTTPALFVNGIAVATTFTTPTDKTKWFSALTGLDTGSLGYTLDSGGAPGNKYTGLIGEVLLYNRVLTLSEIIQNHLATKWRY